MMFLLLRRKQTRRGIATGHTYMTRIRRNTGMEMGKNTDEDDLSARLVIFTIFHLPDPRKKETMQTLLSLLSEPGFRLNLTPIRPFGPTTEPQMNEGSQTVKGVWPSAFAHPHLVAGGTSLRRKSGEQKLREICLNIPGLIRTAPNAAHR
jgi:hypothetical protein